MLLLKYLLLITGWGLLVAAAKRLCTALGSIVLILEYTSDA